MSIETYTMTPIQFYSKLDNEYTGFSNLTLAEFRVPGDQLQAPDGTEYPVFGGGDPMREVWPSVEHYYQAMKFPEDPAWQERIRLASTALQAKKLGFSRAHPLRGDWDIIRERVMKRALVAKFSQNAHLRELLRKTGDRPLEEASPRDAYWGTGMRGMGKNRMGVLLCEVRTELAE